jgi:hypothetical protein
VREAHRNAAANDGTGHRKRSGQRQHSQGDGTTGSRGMGRHSGGGMGRGR